MAIGRFYLIVIGLVSVFNTSIEIISHILNVIAKFKIFFMDQ
jgi:hypothetical protein